MRRAYFLLASGLIAVLALLNVRLYHGQAFSIANPESDVLPQLRYLSGKMRQGAAEAMQNLFPEGFLFTNALYGLAWTDVARYASVSDAQKREALAEAQWALARIESEQGRERFNADLCPPYGIFYQGWRNLLRASILRARPQSDRDSASRIALEIDSDSLVACFNGQSSPFLRSYDNGAWPADAFAAIASLAVYDKTFDKPSDKPSDNRSEKMAGPRYRGFIAAWLAKTDSLRDLYTGLLPHSVDAATGAPMEGARGSSQALILRLMAEIDRVRAARDYRGFRIHFHKSFLGLPGTAEYPKGKPGQGDADSGPIPFGIGAAATIVSIGTARAIGDLEFARDAAGFVEAAGFPIRTPGKKIYGFGQLPIGDAFLCWAKATLPEGTPSGNGWRIPWLFHFASATLAVVLLVPLRIWRRGTKT